MSLRPEIRSSGFELRAFVAVVIAVSSVAATWIVASALRSPPPEPERATIDVSADASHKVTPDHMTWSITVHAMVQDQVLGLEPQVRAIKKFLAEHGVADAEMVAAVATDLDTPDATQVIDVTMSDVPRGMKIYRAAAAADFANASEVDEPTCTLTDEEPAKQAALVAAQQRVHARAEAAAHAYGAKLGRVTTATVGVADIDDPGNCDALTATASANASYELE